MLVYQATYIYREVEKTTTSDWDKFIIIIGLYLLFITIIAQQQDAIRHACLVIGQ